MPVFLLHVGQLLNVSLPVAIYSVALPGLSSCLTLLLELTFAGFLPATIHLLDALLLTYSSNSLRIFMADLPINAVTGKPFDPTLPMFHGTSSAFNLGDVITPAEVAGVPSVHSSENLPNLTSNAFATQDMDRARAYAERAAKKSGGSPSVYRVEPVDLTDLAFDWDAPDNSSWMSEKGFRVVSPAEKEATGKTAVNFANGSIQYAPDGRSYFLHHSPTSGIKVGEKIRTTGFGQVTAGDALVGHSYGWDARTGLTNSVNNQVSARGDDFSVYLTSANTKNVFPDINVPDSPARAVKGTQDVLGEVKIPAGMPRDESEKLVSQMMTRHGIFAEESSIGREIIDRSVLMGRGPEAVDNAIESVAASKNIRLIESLEAQLAKGPRVGVFMAGLPEGHQFHRWSRMADEYEKGGRETALAYLGANQEIRNRQYVSLYCSCCTKSKRVR